MSSTLTLPAHRVLESSNLDQPGDPEQFADGEEWDERFAAVHDAITDGTRVRLDSNRDDAYLQEVCTTAYTDPETGEARFAVEVWNNDVVGKHDFADKDDATDRHNTWCDDLGL